MTQLIDEYTGWTRGQLIFKLKATLRSREEMVKKNAALRARNEKLSRELKRTKEDMERELSQKLGQLLFNKLTS